MGKASTSVQSAHCKPANYPARISKQTSYFALSSLFQPVREDTRFSSIRSAEQKFDLPYPASGGVGFIPVPRGQRPSPGCPQSPSVAVSRRINFLFLMVHNSMSQMQPDGVETSAAPDTVRFNK
jgi:hypothetical protein